MKSSRIQISILLSATAIAMFCGILIGNSHIPNGDKYSLLFLLLLSGVLLFLLYRRDQRDAKSTVEKNEQKEEQQPIRNVQQEEAFATTQETPLPTEQQNESESLRRKCDALESFRNSFPYQISEGYVLFAVLRTELRPAAFSRWQIVGEYNGELWEYSLFRSDSQSYKELLCLATATTAPEELSALNQGASLLWE